MDVDGVRALVCWVSVVVVVVVSVRVYVCMSACMSNEWCM